MPRRTELKNEEEPVAIQLFALLLKGFEKFSSVRIVERPAGIANLLQGFAEVTSKPQAFLTHSALDTLIVGHTSAIEADRDLQEVTADDFNLLDVLQSTFKETRHSMVLAWLLDSDLRGHGTHAQGKLGFKLFLREMQLPESLANHRYWVMREVAGDEARVDIEIASRGRFLIHIENKIWAGEGFRQTDREWSDLPRRGAFDGEILYGIWRIE